LRVSASSVMTGRALRIIGSPQGAPDLLQGYQIYA
jgi:hypothetical protein